MSFTFIDFCAGIGSTRLALENVGSTCLGFSEIDAVAEKTYRLFFGHDEPNFGDLMTIDPESLPDFDIMLGGFPCQTFSIMGQRSGMGDDRGKIILGLAKILTSKQPKAFMLENVKGLLSHDGGRTLAKIRDMLQLCGYQTQCQVMKSVEAGIPQLRERVFVLGVRTDLLEDLEFHQPCDVSLRPLREFLIDRDPAHLLNLDSNQGQTFLRYLQNPYNQGKHKLDDYLKQSFCVLDTRQSDLRIYNGVVPTLRTGRHGIYYVHRGELRALSGMETLLLQGFPKQMAQRAKRHIANRPLLAQAGNAMTVPVVEFVATQLLRQLNLPCPATRSERVDSFVAA